MHKVKYSPKIYLQFFHHHQNLLKETFLQETSPCCHYDHSGFLCMRIGLDCVPMASPSYMSRAYIKHFGKLVLILFDYILVHGRMLKEVHTWFELYVMRLDRELIAYIFVEHEVGRIEILHFGPVVSNIYHIFQHLIFNLGR